MNVQEFYDYITSMMTPEEALKKLLESPLINYEKLKFDKGEEIHPVMVISLAAMDLGWQMAIEKGEEDVSGISVGTEKYMKTLFK